MARASEHALQAHAVSESGTEQLQQRSESESEADLPRVCVEDGGMEAGESGEEAKREVRSNR